jgi:hypothetical protein
VLKHLYQCVNQFSTACLALWGHLMYCLFIVLWFVFSVIVDLDTPTLDNPQDLQEQDLSSLISMASVLDACCTYFLYLPIGLHASILLELLEYLCIISFHVLSLLPGIG